MEYMKYISAVIVTSIAISAILIPIGIYIYLKYTKKEGFQGDVAGGKVVMSTEYCNSLQNHLDSYLKLKNSENSEHIQNLDKTIEQFRGYLKDYGCK